MDGSCRDDQYWDVLVKTCMSCNEVCRRPKILPKCWNHCAPVLCKKKPGHYYDVLVSKCVRCADICGRHPVGCSQHCRPQSQPLTTERVLCKPTVNSRGISVPAALEDSTLLLYSAQAVCMALLLSSLCLALVVFLQRSRHRRPKPGPRAANHTRENTGQSDLEPGWQDFQLQTSHDSVRNSSRAMKQKASEDPRPTETCVCVHCFPDLTSLGHGGEMPHRVVVPFYQQANLPQTQKMGPRWTERRIHTSEQQEGAAMG